MGRKRILAEGREVLHHLKSPCTPECPHPLASAVANVFGERAPKHHCYTECRTPYPDETCRCGAYELDWDSGP